MKLANSLIRFLNTYTSLQLSIQTKQNRLTSTKDDKKEKYLWGNKKQRIEKYLKDLIGKNLDTKSIKNKLFRYTSKDEFLASKSILS